MLFKTTKIWKIPKNTQNILWKFNLIGNTIGPNEKQTICNIWTISNGDPNEILSHCDAILMDIKIKENCNKKHWKNLKNLEKCQKYELNIDFISHYCCKNQKIKFM